MTKYNISSLSHLKGCFEPATLNTVIDNFPPKRHNEIVQHIAELFVNNDLSDNKALEYLTIAFKKLDISNPAASIALAEFVVESASDNSAAFALENLLSNIDKNLHESTRAAQRMIVTGNERSKDAAMMIAEEVANKNTSLAHEIYDSGNKFTTGDIQKACEKKCYPKGVPEPEYNKPLPYITNGIDIIIDVDEKMPSPKLTRFEQLTKAAQYGRLPASIIKG